MNLQSALLLFSFFLATLGCSTHQVKPSDLNLDGFDLSELEAREDFVAMLSELIEGQATCMFSDELLARITTGSSEQHRQWKPEQEHCIGSAEVTEIDFADWAASVWLETNSKSSGRTYHIHALLEEGRWLFYWPEPTSFEAPPIVR